MTGELRLRETSMADLLKLNDHRAYVRVHLPRAAWESLLEQFGGNRHHALRELRLRWEGVVASIDAGNLERAPSRLEQSLTRVSAYAKASRGE